MTIDEMVAKFEPRKIKNETKENLRQILEMKQKCIEIQEANGERVRISLEQHYQRILDNDFDATLESLRTQTRVLGTLSEQYGILFEWPTDWR